MERSRQQCEETLRKGIVLLQYQMTAQLYTSQPTPLNCYIYNLYSYSYTTSSVAISNTDPNVWTLEQPATSRK